MAQPLDLLDVAHAQYDLQVSSEALFDRMCFLQVETRAGGLVLAESTCAQGAYAGSNFVDAAFESFYRQQVCVLAGYNSMRPSGGATFRRYVKNCGRKYDTRQNPTVSMCGEGHFCPPRPKTLSNETLSHRCDILSLQGFPHTAI